MIRLKQIAIYLVVILTCICSTVRAQKNDKYTAYYTGCWQSEHAEDGLLITKENKDFLWIKDAGNKGQTDTLHGTWRITSTYLPPQKLTLIQLDFSSGKRQKYEVAVASMPATIYLPHDHKFHKADCDK